VLQTHLQWELRKAQFREDKMKEQEIGYVSNFMGNISVAIIEMTKGTLKTGDAIHIKGNTTDITETVSSMQIEHEIVDKVKKNDSLGLKVKKKVRKRDKVYKVVD
tara:strand:- start:78 stop:392 length:315 start_codon:yes stop_codon:yes gene_type:complete